MIGFRWCGIAGLSVGIFAGNYRRRHPRIVFLIALLFGVPTIEAAETDEQIIEDTYRAWVGATNEKDIGKWSSFLATNPFFSPADTAPLISREAILDYYERLFSDPQFSIDCEQRDVHVSLYGDMAWSRGVCKVTFTGSEGNSARSASRWFKVWVRDPAGSWKCRVNSWKLEN